MSAGQSDARVFVVVTPAAWDEAQRCGQLATASLHSEGFMHAAGAAQLAGVLARHFAGQADLLRIELDRLALGDALRWEPSARSGECYPHLYAPLPMAAVLAVQPISAADRNAGSGQSEPARFTDR